VESVAAGLDAMNDAAKAAFESADFAAYRDLFAPGPTYHPALPEGDPLRRHVLDRARRPGEAT
jgi:hypothetical protein